MRYFMLHKPRGCISSTVDDTGRGRPTVYDVARAAGEKLGGTVNFPTSIWWLCVGTAGPALELYSALPSLITILPVPSSPSLYDGKYMLGGTLLSSEKHNLPYGVYSSQRRTNAGGFTWED